MFSFEVAQLTDILLIFGTEREIGDWSNEVHVRPMVIVFPCFTACVIQ